MSGSRPTRADLEEEKLVLDIEKLRAEIRQQPLEIEKLRAEIRNAQPVVWIEVGKLLVAAVAAAAGLIGATVAATLLIQRLS